MNFGNDFENSFEDTNLKIQIEEILNSYLSTIIADIDGRIYHASPALLNKTGYSYSELKQKNFRSIISSEDIFPAIREKVLKNKIWKDEYNSVIKNGESYSKLSTIYPLFSKDKIYFIEISEDLSDLLFPPKIFFPRFVKKF